jgi:hypothetical protein
MIFAGHQRSPEEGAAGLAILQAISLRTKLPLLLMAGILDGIRIVQAISLSLGNLRMVEIECNGSHEMCLINMKEGGKSLCRRINRI